ncbi:MAG: phosphatase family protein, partial [Acidimicrobiia bacterium]|nr:phosphatase family protein [Acidimicrobiia bacterium]
HNRTVVWFLIAVMIGQSVLNTIIKWTVQRQRPAIDALVHASGTSFPSGHSAAAAGTWAALAFLAGRHLRGPGRILVAVLAVVVAVMVAASRVLLGVHWLTDVVAGLFVGWGWFTLVAMAFGGRILRFGEPAEAVGAAPGAPGDHDEPDAEPHQPGIGHHTDKAGRRA